MKVLNLNRISVKKATNVKKYIKGNNIKYFIANDDTKLLLLGDVDADKLQNAQGFEKYHLELEKPKYDIMLSEGCNVNLLGWSASFEDCKDEIDEINGTDCSLLMDYHKGKISIVCNETAIIEYEEFVRYNPNVYYYASYGLEDGVYKALLVKANEIGQLTCADLKPLENHSRFDNYNEAMNYILFNVSSLCPKFSRYKDVEVIDLSVVE